MDPRFGAPMPPWEFARRLFPWWTTRNTEGFAFGLKGDTAVTMLEAVAA